MKVPSMLSPILALAVHFMTPQARALTVEEQSEHFVARAVAAEQRGDFEAAKVCLDLAIRAFPQSAEAKERLENLSERQARMLLDVAGSAEKAGDPITALQNYAKAYDIDPSLTEAESSGQRVRDQLKANDPLDLVLPSFEAIYCPLDEFLEDLEKRVRELGQNKAWLPMRVSHDMDPQVRARSIRIYASRSDLTLRKVIDAACRSSSNYLTCSFKTDGPAGYPVLVFSSGDLKSVPRWPQPVPAAPGHGEADWSSLDPRNIEWTSKDGKSIVADFVRVDGESVVVSSKGRDLTLPFSRLSPATIALAKKMAARPDDVLLHYRFDAGSGDEVVDLSGNGRHGKLVGFSELKGANGDMVGASGWTSTGSLNFDGNDDQVKTPLGTADFCGRSFTIEACVSHNNAKDNWSPIVCTASRQYSDPGVIQLTKTSAGHRDGFPTGLTWRLNGLSPNPVHSGKATALCDGAFHHVALVYDKEHGRVMLYFDHLRIETTPGVTGAITGGPAILIGAAGFDRSERWMGLISEVRITGQALDPSQFLQKPKP